MKWDCIFCSGIILEGWESGKAGRCLTNLGQMSPKLGCCEPAFWWLCSGRLTSSTPAVWQLGPRVVLRNANTNLPGTAGTALREPCSCPAMVACAVVRKGSTTALGPWPQVRAPLSRDGPLPPLHACSSPGLYSQLTSLSGIFSVPSSATLSYL